MDECSGYDHARAKLLQRCKEMTVKLHLRETGQNDGSEYRWTRNQYRSLGILET